MLELVDVSKRFGGLVAVDGLSVTIKNGEFLGLIGPNGSGKTTVLNLITGFYHCSSGKITLKGESIEKRKPHEIAKKGISRTFQNTTVFSEMSALDNVVMGIHLRSGLNCLKSLLPTSSIQKIWGKAQDSAFELLKFFEMDEKTHIKSADLSNKDQKLLQILIALASKPQILLLDEPVAGMNYEEIESVMKLIKKVNELGITILLIEHNMKAVMSYCKRVVVLDYGRKLAEGSPEEVKQNENVIRAYLGSPELIT